MNRILFALFLLSAINFFSCSKSDPGPAPVTNDNGKITVNKSSILLRAFPSMTDSIVVDADVDWQVTVSPAESAHWFALSKLSGAPGKNTIILRVFDANPHPEQEVTLNFKKANTSNVLATTKVEQTLYHLEWTKHYGGSKYDVPVAAIKSTDGGIILAGHSNSMDYDVMSPNYSLDLWIVKVDLNGQFMWRKTYGVNEISETAVGLSATADGGCVVVGNYEATGPTGGESHGYTDVLVLKLNSSGQEEWHRVVGGSNSDPAHSITSVSDGIIVAATTNSSDGDVPLNSERSTWLFKLDFSGNTKWSKLLKSPSFDARIKIAATKANGIVLTQNTPGGHKFSTLRLDSTGNMLWEKEYGMITKPCFPSAIVVAPGGDIFETGEFSGIEGDITETHGSWDLWLIKLDDGGNLISKQTFGGTGYDGGRTLSLASDGGLLIGGQTRSYDLDVTTNHTSSTNNLTLDCWVIKLDSGGRPLWQKSIGTSADDNCAAVVGLDNGAFAVFSDFPARDGDGIESFGYNDYFLTMFK